MKKLFVVMLVLVCSLAWAYDLKKVIIGKWKFTVMKEGVDCSNTCTAIIDSKNMMVIVGNEMGSKPYSIKNNKFCGKDHGKFKCWDVVFVSQDEFYIPDQQAKFERIKE